MLHRKSGWGNPCESPSSGAKPNPESVKSQEEGSSLESNKITAPSSEETALIANSQSQDVAANKPVMYNEDGELVSQISEVTKL